MCHNLRWVGAPRSYLRRIHASKPRASVWSSFTTSPLNPGDDTSSAVIYRAGSSIHLAPGREVNNARISSPLCAAPSIKMQMASCKLRQLLNPRVTWVRFHANVIGKACINAFDIVLFFFSISRAVIPNKGRLKFKPHPMPR